MSQRLRVATFNLENLDDKPGQTPSLQDRIAVLRPQLLRIDADVLCLQEVNAQKSTSGQRTLSALAALIQDTPYASYHPAYTVDGSGQPDPERNLVVLSRFPILEKTQILNDYVEKLQYPQGDR